MGVWGYPYYSYIQVTIGHGVVPVCLPNRVIKCCLNCNFADVRIFVESFSEIVSLVKTLSGGLASHTWYSAKERNIPTNLVKGYINFEEIHWFEEIYLFQMTQI